MLCSRCQVLLKHFTAFERKKSQKRLLLGQSFKAQINFKRFVKQSFLFTGTNKYFKMTSSTQHYKKILKQKFVFHFQHLRPKLK